MGRLESVVDLEPYGFQSQPYGSNSTTWFKVNHGLKSTHSTVGIHLKVEPISPSHSAYSLCQIQHERNLVLCIF